jgi:Raf kinase inhibitor-like YbhB/YbcL family protein
MTSRRIRLKGHLVGVAAVAALLASCHSGGDAGQQPAPSEGARQPSSLYLGSSAFSDGQTIPAEYTCDGAARSPPLQWSDAPAGTQSFALVLEDPDAPEGTFRHWGVYDIPAGVHQLAAGAGTSDLKQTANDFDQSGYGPPCPPKGDRPHHYRFRVMALDVASLPGTLAGVENLLAATDGHVLGTAELTATYGR